VENKPRAERIVQKERENVIGDLSEQTVVKEYRREYYAFKGFLFSRMVQVIEMMHLSEPIIYSWKPEETKREQNEWKKR
jgi:hypothetical protein